MPLELQPRTAPLPQEPYASDNTERSTFDATLQKNPIPLLCKQEPPEDVRLSWALIVTEINIIIIFATRIWSISDSNEVWSDIMS